MPYYEMIFEVGTHSILNASTDEEVINAAKEQHQRAKSGLPNGPAGDRADRVVRILKYDNDPGDIPQAQPAKDVKARLADLVAEHTDANGNVNLTALSTLVEERAVLDTPVHESNYAAPSTGELDPKSWGGEAL